MTADAAPAPDPARARLRGLLAGIEPWDALERAHLAAAAGWVRSGAPLHRTTPPDVPPTHLVSYFVPRDPDTGRVLLVDHRRARLWLPPGGHVEPGEDPWDTVRRECREELHVEARPATVARPLFLTVTRTRGDLPGRHTDVSLWYVLEIPESGVTSYDRREFAGIAWHALDRVPDLPLDTVDPHLHRFARKLAAALG